MTGVGSSPAPLRVFLAGARPRTVPVAVVPVVVGVALASREGPLTWWRAGLALVVSLAIQIGTNYANDYSDGIRGADAQRVGPARLVGGGLASPSSVKLAALSCFALAGVAGLVLALSVSLWLLAVGAASIAAGWFYTGGRRPYGYLGYGEIFVFVFFGLVAVTGSAYVSAGRFVTWDVAAGVPVGLLAVALLVVNNLRDIPGDTLAGKKTLAVRIGERATRQLYVGVVVVGILGAALLASWHLGALLGLVALVVAYRPVVAVRRGSTGSDLIAVLVATGMVQLVFGLAFAIGIAW